MNKSITFGVVGGYGATGRAVVSELRRATGETVLIGGRDLAKGQALAAKFGCDVVASHLDVFDLPSLDEFCGRCSIIVNCAGPVTDLRDRVAQAAFRNHCHYVDPAGMSAVMEGMTPVAREIADAGLSFVVSAGWMPGMSELVPVYAHAQARLKMEVTESVTVFVCDSGDWSRNALLDGVRYIHGVGLRNPGYFRSGEWIPAGVSAALRRFDLGDPVGSGRFLLCFPLPELRKFAARLNGCDVLTYTNLSGFRTLFSATLMSLLPLPESIGVRLLRNIFKRNRLPVGGFVIAKVLGRFQSRNVSVTVRVTYKKDRDYWINGVVLATVARMILSGRAVQHGVHFLADAVTPTIIMAELQNAGVEKADNWTSLQ